MIRRVKKMKKITSLLLVVIFVLSALCFTSCGKINDTEVSILWKGEGEAVDPDSLINSFERALYIENIKYAHYGANNDADEQLRQANAAIDAGCTALAVELINPLMAQQIVDAAAAKSIPVVFFNCLVDAGVLASYDKCVLVSADITTISDVQGKQIADYVKANLKTLDKNGDNKISYVNPGLIDISLTETKANELLAKEEYKTKNLAGDKVNASLSNMGVVTDYTEAELIITDDDVTASAVLAALQSKDYNTDKLTTQLVPIFTVGATFDYKAAVIAGRPEIPSELVIKEGDGNREIKNKDKEIKKLEALQNYYLKNKYLVDLTAINESELDEMIYTTLNVIADGRIAGTVYADYDEIAASVAKIISNMIKGKDTFNNVASKVKEGEIASVTVDGKTVSVRYTVYPD